MSLRPVRAEAEFLPFTHALDRLRQAVLNGKGLVDLRQQVLILSTFAVVLLPLSLAFFAWTFLRPNAYAPCPSFDRLSWHTYTGETAGPQRERRRRPSRPSRVVAG
jgi:hypothetical protein